MTILTFSQTNGSDPERLVRAANTDAVRSVRHKTVTADLVVVGGGMAGCCAAITAARAGLRVALVQDRPVLGGNASSEVRLWILGATAHMGTNNRWAREGGVCGELMVENCYRNPGGNPLIFDALLLEWVVREDSIQLFLNTAVDAAEKSAPDRISAATAYCSQNQTRYRFEAPQFMDASGDGVLAFAAGAAFRQGAETKEEFEEAFAPDREFGNLLGQTIYFYSKDAGRSVPFVAPDFALQDIKQIPRYSKIGAHTQGCHLWWFEYGGRHDPIHDTEAIKWELWRVVYGVWNHIKNSGQHPEAENLTLEWVGTVPGKRESRRFEGDYIMRQQDIVERRRFDDAIAHGGWSVDLHPADGVYANRAGSHHLYGAAPYTIPLRSTYSAYIRNCFTVGRILSASHVAFGTTRVMGTCSVIAQGAATAAVLCHERGCDPTDLQHDDGAVTEIQRRLMRIGQHIPGLNLAEAEDFARQAQVSASSSLCLKLLPDDGPRWPLTRGLAQMLPGLPGAIPAFSVIADVPEATALRVELRCSDDRPDEHSPHRLLQAWDLDLAAGDSQIIGPCQPTVTLEDERYLFWCLVPAGGHKGGGDAPPILVHTSLQQTTGLLSLVYNNDIPQRHFGGEDVQFWSPTRRPDGFNLAFILSEAVAAMEPARVQSGSARPTSGPEAWVADPIDPQPQLTLTWEKAITIAHIELALDVDYDHAMESAQWDHCDRVMPFVVCDLCIHDGSQAALATIRDNHHGLVVIDLEQACSTDALTISIRKTGGAPAAIHRIRVYAP